MPSPKLVNIDPIGNLLIISEVSGKPTPYHFRVSSKTLSLASPLFASLFPDAASHSGQYQLTISDDTPETVGTLLELCHFGRTAPLPYAPLKGLYSLAKLSQKYAIVSPLVPWISIWAEPLHTLGKLDFSKGEDLNTWLTVTCVYNQGPLFLKVTKQAVHTGSAEILDVSRWQYPYSEIIGEISLKRIDALSKLTAIALTLLGRYQITESICKQSTNSQQCDAILLGSVLKGLMGLGVYQPIPEAPYPGMTVMDLANRIENFPFMWDTAHGDTCGATIKDEMQNTMKLVAEILSEVNGLDLKKFKFKMGWGQVESLAVTAVESLDDVIQQGQGHQEEELEVNKVSNRKQDEQEEGENKQQEEGTEDQEDEEQEVGEQLEEDGDIETKTSAEDDDKDTTVASENESVISMMTEPPAGVMDDFLETEETVQDFGPQKFFGDTGLNQTAADISDDGDDDGDQKSITEGPIVKNMLEESENEMVLTGLRFAKETQVEKRAESPTVRNPPIQKSGTQSAKDEDCLVDQQVEAMDLVAPEKQKEQLRPEAKDFIPSFPLGPAPPERNRHHMPRNRRELAQPLRPALGLQHVASRANAEAKGHQWEAPGLGLVQKYQRGPRSRFHPEVTVGDVSEPDHAAETKRLKELFPQLDNKIVFECLRQNNWNSEETIKVLSDGKTQMSFANEVTTKFSVPGPTVFHAQESIISPHQVSPGTSTANTQHHSGDSIDKSPLLKAPEVHGEVSGAQKNTTSAPNLISGTSNCGIVDTAAHFWPAADSATVLRAVKLPENSLTIRKLLAIFPSARADKGFIDVLYRCGWDLEKAAKKLEGLGLVRKASSADAGDAGKPKGKGKAKAKGDGK